MRIPIVMTAFGTTTKAQTVYQVIDAAVRREFPRHEIRWAYTSRIVRDRLRNDRRKPIPTIGEVLHELAAQGHQWAVVQSLHLIHGHEFYRLVEEVQQLPLRTSIGLPLLSSYWDYRRVAQSFFGLHNVCASEATVLVGHGTDHAAWSAYPTLQTILREVWGPNIYVGVVEGHPSQNAVVAAVCRSGFKKVRIIPFMLVAGVHVAEDLSGGEGSWQDAFEAAGLQVSMEAQSIGVREEIMQIFVDHIREALNVIPR